MMSADDLNRSIIIVLGRSERQVVEFGAENLMKKEISRQKKTILPSVNTLILGGKNVQLTALTLSCNRNKTGAG